MLILGIETSCDDTALALVRGSEVLGSVRLSQKEHSTWGGVVPELAARAHQAHWKEVLEQLWKATGKSWTEVDLIAVTQGPGLQPSLLAGTTLGSFWSSFYDKPLVGVHHILGHILSVHLDRKNQRTEEPKNQNYPVTQLSSYPVELPALVLTVSGGHTELHLREELKNQRTEELKNQRTEELKNQRTEELKNRSSQEPKLPSSEVITKLGSTLDDAAGEAFDKVAKMMHLGYPGGPEVSKWAEQGDVEAFELPRIYLDPQSLDFSFSGLKAAVRRIVEKHYPEWLEPVGDKGQGVRDKEEEQFIADLCASFQHTVFLTFKKKIQRCLDRYPDIRQVHFVGGVSANRYISEQLQKWLSNIKYQISDNKKRTEEPKNQNSQVPKFSSSQVDLLTPTKLEYCTDNGAMIAYAGGWLCEQDPARAKVQHIEPSSRLELDTFLNFSPGSDIENIEGRL
ncbi:MAG TPA: tRNA (adenosine(37)-N6)-threonylcarbamoyltransferase complex transferase subunit TsaD [Candidatus Gracilibacteria bacterium]